MQDRHAGQHLGSKRVTILVSDDATPHVRKYLRYNFTYIIIVADARPALTWDITTGSCNNSSLTFWLANQSTFWLCASFSAFPRLFGYYCEPQWTCNLDSYGCCNGGWQMNPRTTIICCNALAKYPHPADIPTSCSRALLNLRIAATQPHLVKDVQAIAIKEIYNYCGTIS